MQWLIDLYIERKANAWSHTTLKSERARLTQSINLLEAANPAEAHEQLRKAGRSPYTIKTAFIRFSSFYDWLCLQGHAQSNPFSSYMKVNANLFKHAYKKERVSLTFKEAADLIAQIEDVATREKAKRLLVAGLRYAESFTEKNGEVVGKGGKVRKVFNEGVGSVAYEKSYSTLRRALAKVGLKPHTLRKLFATQMIENGAQEADLLEVLGWSSIQTAAIYLQPKRDEQLARLISNPF